MSSYHSHPDTPASAAEHVSLCEALDRVLNKGVVLAGDLIISVADIDLIYLGLQAILTSVETARNLKPPPPIHIGAHTEGRA